MKCLSLMVVLLGSLNNLAHTPHAKELISMDIRVNPAIAKETKVDVLSVSIYENGLLVLAPRSNGKQKTQGPIIFKR